MSLNPSAKLFTDNPGLVCFDPEKSKEIISHNKEVDLNYVATKDEIDDFSSWCSDKKFYCFHGDHRREAIRRLHEVCI
jgi:hypothetical protein